MKTNSLTHLQTVRSFKSSVMGAVEARKFDEGCLHGLLSDVFGKERVEVFYDNDYLAKGSLSASHVFNGVHNFVFREEPLDEMRRLSLPELERKGLLVQFAQFCGEIVHETSHGVYEDRHSEQKNKVFNALEDSLRNNKDVKKLGNVVFALVQNALHNYSKPEQLQGAIQKSGAKLSDKPNDFAQNAYKIVIDSLKDEAIAHLEGFNAIRDVLGKDAVFFDQGLSFAEAKDFVLGGYHMARESYAKAFPVKKKS